MVGKAWESVQEREIMICRILKKTRCVITKNNDDDKFIQLQCFCGNYNLGNGKMFEMHPLSFSASDFSEKNPDED